MINKNCYKWMTYYFKYAPMLIALLVTVNNFFQIDSPELGTLDYVFTPSLFTIVNMYIGRKVFRLCTFHRLFVDYTLINCMYRIIDCEIFISAQIWILLYISTLVVFLLLLIYYRPKSNI